MHERAIAHRDMKVSNSFVIPFTLLTFFSPFLFCNSCWRCCPRPPMNAMTGSCWMSISRVWKTSVGVPRKDAAAEVLAPMTRPSWFARILTRPASPTTNPYTLPLSPSPHFSRILTFSNYSLSLSLSVARWIHMQGMGRRKGAHEGTGWSWWRRDLGGVEYQGLSQVFFPHWKERRVHPHDLQMWPRILYFPPLPPQRQSLLLS